MSTNNMALVHPLRLAGLVGDSTPTFWLARGTPASLGNVRVEAGQSEYRGVKSIGRVTLSLYMDARDTSPQLTLSVFDVRATFYVGEDDSIMLSSVAVERAISPTLREGGGRKSRSFGFGDRPVAFEPLRTDLSLSVTAKHLALWVAILARLNGEIDRANAALTAAEAAEDDHKATIARSNLTRLNHIVGVLSRQRDAVSGQSSSDAQRALQTAARLMDEQREAAAARRVEAARRREEEDRRRRLAERSDDVLAILLTLASGASFQHGLGDKAREILNHVDHGAADEKIA